MPANKLIIVSTRLPVRVYKENGKIKYKASEGGLATGMTAVSRTYDNVWVGWPGISSSELSKKEEKQIVEELKNKYNCHPVFLDDIQIENYYSGYCNATIWPLFHYFSTSAEHDDAYWESYKEVNKLFYEETAKFISEDSMVWVHDYQLMLLPELIRKRQGDVCVGFFLHTPFPSFEIFRLLPNRVEILNGLLGANLIGFHTYDYVGHFLKSTLRLLGHESSLGAITVEGRRVQTDAFPIGIDYNKFAKNPQKSAVKELLRSFNLFEEKTKVILTVDRADYSKGIPDRLDSYGMFLEENPKYHGKVVLVLLAVPSRGGVGAYQELRSTIEQKVGRINGTYASVDWSPISYRYQSLPFNELSALYAMADVMMVTPIRDGMNLVAKEYIASHHKSDGVLILSEMAGVATELPEALLVNPSDRRQVVNSIKQALEMPQNEQKSRMKVMQNRISEYTIHRWARDFMSELARTELTSTTSSKRMNDKRLNNLKSEYNNADSRLILLDYDGTLKGFANSPDVEQSVPSSRLKKLLRKLTKDKKNRVIIVSGRPKSTLTAYFDNIHLGLIAEHGGWIFDAGEWVKSSVASKRWKKKIKPFLDQYVTRTPGSEVEEKDFSLVWHYRRVSPDLAYVRKEELKTELKYELNDSDIGVFEGKKIIEVKPTRMHKGALVTEILSNSETQDFIMAIGDDYTDEDMFQALPERAFSIQVGNSNDTFARYQVDGVQQVLELLEDLGNQK